MLRALAHTGGPGGETHGLTDHLRDVARKCSDFAERARPCDADFRALASWAGWLHDLGKFRPEFQDYLLGRRAGSLETQHAVFGAAWAWNDLPKAIALAVNGHHAGLPSFETCHERVLNEDLKPQPTSELLIERLKSDLAALDETLPERIAEVFRRTKRQPLPVRHEDEFLTRMLFSCLVDADYLDTERFMRGGRTRDSKRFEPSSLLEKVEAKVRRFPAGQDALLASLRRDIYESCIREAIRAPGFFCLTAPTGGGKTLASLAFALRHAVQHEHTHRFDRVILVLPFLTIIEQNAGVYRKVLGDAAVVEHHSGRIPGAASENEAETPEQVTAKQATENWDAPIVVTTTVQFLESLFDRKPARCRKLHNIAHSVVVFDEVQTMPHHLLEPILSVLRELKTHYGTSFLFCSATQPRFPKSNQLPSGFGPDECREVAPSPAIVFRRLQRTRYDLAFLDGKWDWETLVDRITREPQVLVVVNLRRHAAKLFQLLQARGVGGLSHLSSTMCPEHRSDVLGEREEPAARTVHEALTQEKPCRLISTQVVEAGVDIDFPVVLRALAPLDGIIQAGGRCNREGKLPHDASGSASGRVVVFELDGERNTPPEFYAFATEQTRQHLKKIGADPDRLAVDPDLYSQYHEALIAWKPTDARSIQEARAKLDFETVAEKFRLIEQAGETVVIPYRARRERGLDVSAPSEAERLIAAIALKKYATINQRRKLQRYSVSLYPQEIQSLHRSDSIIPLIAGDESVWKLKHGQSYDEALGMIVGELPVDVFAQF
jgi:CRISPR-associated endonuclease/helicase Cas3